MNPQLRAGTAVPAAAAVVAVVLACWFNVTTAGLRFQVVCCWLAVAVFASSMSYFAFRASRQMDPSNQQRRFWSALAIAAAVFGAGEWAQVVTAIVSPLSLPALTGTGPARTTALALGCLGLTAVVLSYPIPHRSARERICYLLDLATVVIAAGTYGVYWSVTSASDQQTIMADDLATVIAGPVVAIMTAFTIGRLYLSNVAPFNWHIGVIGPFAAVVEAIARALGPNLVAAGRPGVIFTMTVASHALLMTAAWGQYRSGSAGKQRHGTSRKRSFSMLPYGALWLTFALLVVSLVVRGSGPCTWTAVAGLAAITGVVVARQLISFVSNEELLVERDALAARLHTMAFTDNLTGLANRAQFLDRLDDALGDLDTPVGVLLIDLDDFKPVNDTHGHAAGDAVLVQSAERLRGCVGPADVVARLGGDEFAVLIARCGADDLAAVADRVVRALDQPCPLADGAEARVRASVGGAVSLDASRDALALLHTADQAMYEAKCAGKGAFRLAAVA
ncbi:GGDEF domain-containing protein [Actinoplanes ianthinogenes]|uniref:GGDEF domain-containing protein n=1 Tax=Actinoplanes ianthinogenes TaxID=122358 RepID=UPI00167041B7|nr:GGDEF domain-containing protein [Actinoplanes ianthinogenes]